MDFDRPIVIVSEDNHFSVLKKLPFPVFNVVTMDEFMKKLYL